MNFNIILLSTRTYIALKLILVILFAFISFGLTAENFLEKQIDSLENKLKISKGEEEARIIGRLAYFYYRTQNPEKAYRLFKKALTISENNNYCYSGFRTFENFVSYYNRDGKYNNAINALYTEIGDL